MSVSKKVFLILMFLWMFLIFFYSSRPADISEQDSGRIGVWLGRMFVPGFEEWPEDKQEEFAGRVDHPIRKTAHVTEYAILGILVAGVCAPEKRKYNSKTQVIKKERENYFVRRLVLPWLIAAAYAATDEFHQLFVPGRSGQISDVILDSVGALAGIVVFVTIHWIIKKKRQRR